MIVDLNCDLGEGAGHDAELLALVSTANVCCGVHAGDPTTSLTTIQMAARLGVRVGAHPGLPDREHFGRRDIDINGSELKSVCVQQIASLQAMAASCAIQLSHIKLHGALYHLANRDAAIARIVTAVAEQFQLPMFGLPMSELECACAGRVAYVREGFADRKYRVDGSLVPRDQPGAFVNSPDEAVAQIETLISKLGIHTVCVHGDRADAVAFVDELRKAWLDRGHSFGPWP